MLWWITFRSTVNSKYKLFPVPILFSFFSQWFMAKPVSFLYKQSLSTMNLFSHLVLILSCINVHLILYWVSSLMSIISLAWSSLNVLFFGVFFGFFLIVDNNWCRAGIQSCIAVMKSEVIKHMTCNCDDFRPIWSGSEPSDSCAGESDNSSASRTH